jgi:hypothetical protein
MRHPVEHKLTAITKTVVHALGHIPEGGSGGSQALTQAYGVLARLSEGGRALVNLHSHRNPTVTEGTHTKHVATAAQAFTKEVEVARERARKLIADGLINIDKQIAAKANLVPDAYAAEVRGVFRGLAHSERLKFLNELLEQGRGPEFAAIIKAPRSLTGITEDMRQKFESAFVAKHAAAELLDRDALNDALETVEVVSRTAAEVAQAYNDPAKLAEITKAEEAAAAAQKAFESSVKS